MHKMWVFWCIRWENGSFLGTQNEKMRVVFCAETGKMGVVFGAENGKWKLFWY